MTKADFYLEDLKTKFAKINPDEYYLAYSGGKDSHLLYWFIKEILKDTKIKIISVNTYMEFPEISARMKKYADKVLIPKMKPHEVIAKVGTPCFGKNSDDIIGRYQRGSRSASVMKYINGTKNDGKTMFKLNNNARDLLLNGLLPPISNLCCQHLKKNPSHEYEQQSGRKAILGMTRGESQMRDAQYNSCFTKDGKFTPLWDADDKLINEIYTQYQIEIPEIYKYVSQTGCAGCPYGMGFHETEVELALMTPNKRRYVTKLFGEAYRIRGLEPDQMTIFDFDKENK